MRTVVSLAALVALTACEGLIRGDDAVDSAPPPRAPSLAKGEVAFELSLPAGDALDSLSLVLSCRGLTQELVVDLAQGRAVVAFGGLNPGPCGVTARASTADGSPCQGRADFVIGENTVTRVALGVTCMRDPVPSGGGVVVEIELESTDACWLPGVALVSAGRWQLMAGESTLVQVRSSADLAAPVVHFSLHGEGNADPRTISLGVVAACGAGALACRRIACARSNAGVRVEPAELEIRVTDGECTGAARVVIECAQDARQPVCGDGQVQGSEECDDGNADDGDACSSRCTHLVVEPPPTCGNGLLDRGEECDGTAGLPAPAVQSCSAECRIAPVCRNGIREGDEPCDGTDGIDPATQTCSERCQIVMLSRCGNGVLDRAEECDGNAGLMTGQVCSVECTLEPVCPNGIVETGEACDDGNEVGEDGCDASCERSPNCMPDCPGGGDPDADAGACDSSCMPPGEMCGDGMLGSQEQCDGTAGLIDPALQRCGADCRVEAICGNGFVEGVEQCDDGNVRNGDGCNRRCMRS